MNYITTIEQFFLTLKDSGIALSANDYQLIDEWRERKIPVKLICRAIEFSYSKMDRESQGHRHKNISLTQFQKLIEEEIQAEIYKT